MATERITRWTAFCGCRVDLAVGGDFPDDGLPIDIEPCLRHEALADGVTVDPTAPARNEFGRRANAVDPIMDQLRAESGRISAAMMAVYTVVAKDIFEQVHPVVTPDGVIVITGLPLNVRTQLQTQFDSTDVLFA